MAAVGSAFGSGSADVAHAAEPEYEGEYVVEEEVVPFDDDEDEYYGEEEVVPFDDEETVIEE